MAIRMNYEDDELIVFYVSGVLTKDELDSCQQDAEAIIQQGNAKILGIVLDDFTGWSNEGDWADLSFQQRNDAFIKKMAVVCDPKWRDLTAMFTLKGIRKFPIEHFTPEKEDFARIWLTTD
ncbi:hypothetical protein A9Q78_08620 [Methylophaga sp. 41_12_T18]|mgnify:FL=1|nr:hypothetical protein A9Q78_08620 [Methylophaga sp. 41_12_T18]